MVKKALSIWDQEPLNKIDLLKEYLNWMDKYSDRPGFLQKYSRKTGLSKSTIWNRICYLRKNLSQQEIINKRTTAEENDPQVPQTLFYVKELNKHLTITQIKKQRARIERQKKKTSKLSILWEMLDKEISKIEKSSLYKQAEKQVEGLNEEIDKFTQRQKDYTEKQVKETAKQLNIPLKEKKSTSMNLTQHEVTDKRNAIKITSWVLLDKNGKEGLEFKPFDLVDTQKLIKFCDEQLKIRKEKGLKGGMRIIHRALADLMNTTEDAVSARYYEGRRRKDEQKEIAQAVADKIKEKYDELLQEKEKYDKQLKDKEEENRFLRHEMNKAREEVEEKRNKTNELLVLIEKLKRNPIVKFAYTISKLGGHK